MNKVAHIIYVGTMVAITVWVTGYLSYTGYQYYTTPLEERYYLENHDWFKPSGLMGHGLGIVGTLLMLIGVVIYILHKRYEFLGKWIRLRYLLEFHIFLCTVGPIMILFHTAFKFGGIVSVAFWSMVAVVVSGVIGRFIYIQIPRTIEGRELSLQEIHEVQNSLSASLQIQLLNDKDLSISIQNLKETTDNHNSRNRRKNLKLIKKQLRSTSFDQKEKKSILRIVKQELNLAGKISRLKKMQQLFKYWHVAHLPFALIMLIIVVLHVAVTLAFGYTWIF
ncbi:MAG: hypothetical protein NXI20_10325 [bacterium]|nr:hypothetical protein [bacterium]